MGWLRVREFHLIWILAELVSSYKLIQGLKTGAIFAWTLSDAIMSVSIGPVLIFWAVGITVGAVIGR